MSHAALVVLVLVSALLHALWNAMLRRQSEREVAGVIVVAAAALTALLAAVVTAWGRGAWPFPSTASLGGALVAGIFEGTYFIALVAALARGPLGVVYTVSRGGAILLVWPISVYWLAEAVSAPALAGTLLVLLGITASGGAPGSAGQGLVPALLAAVSIAGYHLAYKVAIAAGGEPAAVFALSLGIAVPLNVLNLMRAGRLAHLWPAVRARPAWTIGAGLVCGGSFLLFMAALAHGGAGFVLTLRNTSIVFAVLMSWRLGEPPTRPQAAGALLVTAGALLLGWR